MGDLETDSEGLFIFYKIKAYFPMEMRNTEGFYTGEDEIRVVI